MAILPLFLVIRLNGPLAPLTREKWTLPFGEALQYGRLRDEGMHFCLLCLIGIRVIAIHVIGRFNWGLYFTCDMIKSQS